jgi:AraC-like DNA-binding protein
MKRRQPTTATPDPAPDFFSPDVTEARRFYLDLNPAKNRPLVIVTAGVERTAPAYAIHRPGFPFFAIEYVVRGQGAVKLKGRTYVLQPGRLFSYGPGIQHDIAADAAEPLVKYFVNFTGRHAQTLLASCGLAPGRVSQVFPVLELQALFEELIHCGLHATPHSAALCLRLFECIVFRIADSRTPEQGTESMAFTTYQECRLHILQHFRRLRSLEEIGAERHVNVSYLCRLFRRFNHQTPYQLLLRLKMNRAAELLQQPGALVKQVAEDTGFDDPFHFSRAFKSVFGVAPDTFRRLR